VHVQWGGATRRAWTHVDAAGERTITVLGDKLLPAGPLPLEGYDLVFFVAGGPEALGSARRARFVAATVRELPTLRESGVELDLLVASANDPGERYDGSAARPASWRSPTARTAAPRRACPSPRRPQLRSSTPTAQAIPLPLRSRSRLRAATPRITPLS
jgi:hypothetical protein